MPSARQEINKPLTTAEVYENWVKLLIFNRKNFIKLELKKFNKEINSFFKQLLQQNLELRQAHQKSLTEMEELRKFQSSTFDTIARRRLVEDQDTILEHSGRIQELQNEINCMSDSQEFQDADQFAVEVATLPVDQCHSHLIQFLKEV